MKHRLRMSFHELMHFELPELTPSLAAGAEPAPAPEPEPAAWAGPSEEDWGSVMGYIQAQQEAAAYQAEQAAQQQSQEPSPYYEVDPFSDAFGTQLQGLIAQAVQQSIAPLQEYQYGQQLGEAHDRAFDIIADDVARNGEYLLGEQAYEQVEARANAYMAEMSERYGYGPKAAEAALAQAAADQREYEAALANAAVERHMNQLRQLGGAPAEPIGAASAASSGFRVPPGGDEWSVLEAFGGAR